MTKNDLVSQVAGIAELSKKDSEKAVNAVLQAITGALKAGDKVALVGFGTFETRNRPARKGRNPQTKQEIMIPATVAPAFKAGKALKEAVAKK
ncbi:HU family DNA-binding protein [Ruminococcaceae bacterium OttesenSCG-928-A16]|nr:HU family DNA-binding protein [Ruminococcaceae bacterium OttesenSCG-928-A16]